MKNRLIFTAAAQPVDELQERKCERAFFSSAPSSTFKCTYTCKGWPIRSENEPDGIRCGLIRRTGVCRGGKCVSADDAKRPSNDAVEVSSTTVSTEQRVPTAARLVSADIVTSDVPSNEETAIAARVTRKDEELVTEMATLNARLLAAEQRPTGIPSTNERTTAFNEGLSSDDVKTPPNDTNGESSTPARTEQWVSTTTARLTREVNATFEVPSTKDTVTTTNITTETKELVTELVTENATVFTAEYRTEEETTASTDGRNGNQRTSFTTEPDVLTLEPSRASTVKSDTLLPSPSTPSGSHSPVLRGGILSAILFCSIVFYASSNLL